MKNGKYDALKKKGKEFNKSLQPSDEFEHMQKRMGLKK